MVIAKYKNVHILFDENLRTDFCTDDNTEQFKLHFTEINKQVDSLENHQGALCTSMTRRVMPVGLRFWQGHPCWTGQRVKVRRKVIHLLPRLGVGRWTEKSLSLREQQRNIPKQLDIIGFQSYRKIQ